MPIRSLALRVTSLLLVLGSIAGCTTPQSSLWSEADAHREIHVQRIELHHDVAFAKGSSDLTQAESKRLDDFITRQQVGYGDAVEIRVPGNDQRAEARQAATVGERLTREGVAFTRSPVASPGGVRVAVVRSVAIPPACPDWRKPDDDGDPSNTAMSNFGCANMRNLGLMIADPSELLVGRSSTSGAGEPLAAGVERYRIGKVTPLLETETNK
jgi:pilus assembly protein CpaD